MLSKALWFVAATSNSDSRTVQSRTVSAGGGVAVPGAGRGGEGRGRRAGPGLGQRAGAAAGANGQLPDPVRPDGAR